MRSFCFALSVFLLVLLPAQASAPGASGPLPEAQGADGGAAASSAPPRADNSSATSTPWPHAPGPGGTDEGEDDEEEDSPQALATPLAIPRRTEAPPIATVRSWPKDKDLLARARRYGERFWIKGPDGEEPLTLDAAYHDKLEQILRSYDTPYAAVVAMDPQTGRVLAMAEHSSADKSLRGLSTRAVYPAASIFKIITGAALLKAGVKPDDSECFHGGKRRLSERLLQDSARDSRCYTLATAMGMSANVVFGKLTQKHLTATVLQREAEAFFFNRPIPFPVPTDISMARFPDDPFELALTGAGFGDVYLSPLHGAAIAAVAATGGLWRAPILLERDVGAQETLPRVLSEEQARALTLMLEETCTTGTARRVFRERGYRVQGAVGKTGSLADRKPFRDYSWFVGFAPKEDPQIAVSAVVVNEPKWRIRAPWLGREAMRLFLEARAQEGLP